MLGRPHPTRLGSSFKVALFAPLFTPSLNDKPPELSGGLAAVRRGT